MWQSKQSCHWWDCNAQGACASMPMLAPRARNYLLTAASRMGHWQGQKPADNTKSSAQRTTSTCCHVVASENAAPRASRRCAEPPRVWYTEGHNDKTAHNAVTSRQVQLDRSTHARKRAGGSLWHCTPHSRQLLQAVLIRFHPWKCSRDFASSLGSFLTWCDLGDFDSPAISVALSKAWSRLAETQGN